LAERQAGADDAAYNKAVLGVLAAYDEMAKFDRDNSNVRVVDAILLESYAAKHPESDAVQRAILIATEAVNLAPRDPAALGALAKAYEAAGRLDEAEKTAQLAHSIAPAYSMQTLGSLGLDTSTTP
jgi:Flp pilus assembly protein TadD